MTSEYRKKILHHHIFKYTGQLILDKEFSHMEYAMLETLITRLHQPDSDSKEMFKLIISHINLMIKRRGYKPLSMGDAMLHGRMITISQN